jgi:hypothetical protein
VDVFSHEHGVVFFGRFVPDTPARRRIGQCALCGISASSTMDGLTAPDTAPGSST